MQNQQKWADAMKEDATVFQYDEVYDKMEEDKGAEAKKKEAQKKDDNNPKYRIHLPLVPHPPTHSTRTPPSSPGSVVSVLAGLPSCPS